MTINIPNLRCLKVALFRRSTAVGCQCLFDVPARQGLLFPTGGVAFVVSQLQTPGMSCRSSHYPATTPYPGHLFLMHACGCVESVTLATVTTIQRFFFFSVVLRSLDGERVKSIHRPRPTHECEKDRCPRTTRLS